MVYVYHGNQQAQRFQLEQAVQQAVQGIPAYQNWPVEFKWVGM